jgi:carboxyl-terminal processing protease
MPFVKNILVSGIVFLAFGASAVSAAETKDKSERYRDLEIFNNVMHFIENNYVDEVKKSELMHGAIKGMLETLDPHSNFMPPDVFRDMQLDTSGKFGGVGIEIGMKDNVLTVISPIEDTPAWRAGLKPNDRIVKINGESTKGFTLTEAVSKMRGKKGSEVKLSVYRAGMDRFRDVSLKRETIKIQSVKFEDLEPGFGYVRLTSFNENASEDLKKAIAKLEQKNKLRGLVFDLRMNPGGLLDQAVEVSSLFIDDGIVVSTIGRNKDQKDVKYARKGVARKDFPVAVLVNSSTASAAEIVAGALQDHHRAVVMGQPTFGKGSVQTVIPIGQDMGLKLTIARYYTPSGRSIQEKGVQPDILLDDFDSKILSEARRKQDGMREKDLKSHLVNTDDDSSKEFKKEELDALAGKGKKPEVNAETKDDEMTPLKFEPKEDYQVREALNYIKSYEAFKKTGITL